MLLSLVDQCGQPLGAGLLTLLLYGQLGEVQVVPEVTPARMVREELPAVMGLEHALKVGNQRVQFQYVNFVILAVCVLVLRIYLDKGTVDVPRHDPVVPRRQPDVGVLRTVVVIRGFFLVMFAELKYLHTFGTVHDDHLIVLLLQRG